MTDYAGILVDRHEAPPLNVVAAAIEDWYLPLPLESGNAETSVALAGAWGDNFPLGMPGNAWGGDLVHGYLYDYYFRFWMYPNVINEFVLTELVRTFFIWNSYLDVAVCSDVDITNETEFDLDLATGEPPFSIWSLRTRTFEITIPVEGAAQFTSIISFTFTDKATSYATLIVTRVVVFSWEFCAPGFQETLQWQTDIIAGRNTSYEQRHCIRKAPRQGFHGTVYLPTEQEQSHFDAAMLKYHKRAWGVPIWAEWTKDLTAITAGAEVLYLDTSHADYRDDSMAIIWQNSRSYEVVQIETVESDRLNLESPVLNTWTGIKYIMPLRVAVMLRRVQRPSAPDGYGRSICDFLVMDNVLLTGYVAAQTYEGLPIVQRSSIVRGEQDIEMDADSELIDYGIHSFGLISDSDCQIITQPHRFRNVGREQCWDFRLFLHSLYGRQKAFWVPSDKEDMVQTTLIQPTSTTFRIEKINLAKYMVGNVIRDRIVFVLPDGTMYPRQVTEWEEEETEDAIVIDADLGVEIAPGECEICFLDRCRLTEDSIALGWESAFVNECQPMLTRILE